MKSNALNHRVTLNIKRYDSKDISISLSRWQFETVVIGVPACILSGLVAIGILIFDFAVRPMAPKQNGVVFSAPLENGVSLRTEVQMESLSQNLGIAAADSAAKKAVLKSKTSALGHAQPTDFLKQKKKEDPQGVSDALTNKLKPASPDDPLRGTQDEKNSGDLIGEDHTERTEFISRKSMKDKEYNNDLNTLDHRQDISHQGEDTNQSDFFSVTKKLKVDEIYDVSARILQSGIGSPVVAKIAMKNLTGKTEAGRLWIKILVSSGDQDQWLTSQINLPADDSMNVKEASFGKRYLFNSWVEHELPLGVPNLVVKEIKEIILGAETQRHGQKVAKVDLRRSI